MLFLRLSQTIYPLFTKIILDGVDGQAAKTMLDLLGPPGGMMEAIAKQRHWLTNEPWQSYIPARDGFNMAVFMQASMNVSFVEAQKQVPSLTAEDWAINGTYLLMAVYGYDMYNLMSRCNCCIFNGDGITKDSGSVAELGIATARGFPLIIFQNSLLTPFANLLDNPMVLGATNEYLDVSQYAWTIPDAIKSLDAKLQKVYKRNTFGELNFCTVNPPAYLPAFWSNVGQNVWNWRYIANKYDSNGKNISQTSDEWKKWWALGDVGKAYIVAKIVVLVRDTQKSFFGESSTDKHKSSLTSQNINFENPNAPLLNISHSTYNYTNTALGQNIKNVHRCQNGNKWCSGVSATMTYLNTKMASAKLLKTKHNMTSSAALTVFMNWPVWNLLQECEMLICSWYVNRSIVSSNQCLAVTKTLNCPYWAIREAVFIPDKILTIETGRF